MLHGDFLSEDEMSVPSLEEIDSVAAVCKSLVSELSDSSLETLIAYGASNQNIIEWAFSQPPPAVYSGTLDNYPPLHNDEKIEPTKERTFCGF
jgi:hypothetical protein